MVKGTLTISLEPPTLSFASKNNAAVTHCKQSDVFDALGELGVSSRSLRECVARLHGEFSETWLTKFGLAP